MSELRFREMSKEDYEQMMELWRQSPGIGLSDADSEHNIGRFLDRNAGLSYVCEFGEHVIGTVLCGHDGRRGYIYHLAVEPASRNRGIGKKLMALSLARLRECGIAKCHLFLYSDNELATKFYERTGWLKRGNLLIYSHDL